MFGNEVRNGRYLNNAGAGIASEKTRQIQYAHMEEEARLGAYVAANNAVESRKTFRERASRLLSAAEPTCIAYMDSASRAWDMSLYGACLKPGDRIVTLSSEFGTNIVSIFHYAERMGAEVDIVRCSLDGSFSKDEFAAMMASASLLAVSHVAAHGSIINPVEWFGEVARDSGVAYLLDGCQAVGQIPVDVEAIGCDAYTATGRKWLCGPRGTGFLFVRPTSVFRTPYVDLANASLKTLTGGGYCIDVAESAKQFELWERNVAAELGLSNAMNEALALLDDASVFDQWKSRSQEIRSAVARNARFQLIGSVESPSSITGFVVGTSDDHDRLMDKFRSAEIAISTMGDWDCPLHFPEGAKAVVRIAPHYYTPASLVAECVSILDSF